MNRLRVLKQRAARGLCGVVRLSDGYYVGSGHGQGNCTGPFVSYREAVQMAARWAMPFKEVKCYITFG